MNPVLVTSTVERADTTAVSLALALAASERGERVGFMRPRGDRPRSDDGDSPDVALARDLLDLEDDRRDVEPVVYSPTFVREAVRGREDPGTVADRVTESFRRLAADRDRMVLTGDGSPATGSVVDLTDADIAAMLDATIVLIAPYEAPGNVDDVLAAAEGLGDRLAGVLFVDVPDAAFDELATDVVPFVEGRGLRVLGTIPRRQALAGVTVGDIARELGADVLTEEVPTDGVVERVEVGVMGPGEALTRFRRMRDAALVTGGDRTEILTLALDAAGVVCLVLTGDDSPPGAVLDRAESSGVPVLRVDGDALTSVDRAECLLRTGGDYDERTIRATRDLMADYADLDALLPVDE